MQTRFLKVEGDNFVKDTKTTALLTINQSVLIQNEARKNLGKNINGNDEEINKLKEQVNNISHQMEDIKSMLKIMLDKKD